MLNNFIYAKTKSLFEEKLANNEILPEAIVFIEDTKEIWNRGTYFGASDAKLDLYLDTVMSDTSENGVQNKVIKTYVDESMENYIPLSRDFNNDFNNDFAI